MLTIICGDSASGGSIWIEGTADEFIERVLEKDKIAGYADMETYVQTASRNRVIEAGKKIAEQGRLKIPRVS